MRFMIASEHIEKFQSIFISSRRLRLVKKQQQTAIRTIYGAMYYIYPLSDTNEIKWRFRCRDSIVTLNIPPRFFMDFNIFLMIRFIRPVDYFFFGGRRNRVYTVMYDRVVH